MKIFLYAHICAKMTICAILKLKKQQHRIDHLVKGMPKMESCNNHYQPLITTTKIIINLKNNLTLPRAKMVSNKHVFTNSKWYVKFPFASNY